MKEVVKVDLMPILMLYKDGDVYTNMSKKEKRKMTYERFIEIFCNTHQFQTLLFIENKD